MPGPATVAEFLDLVRRSGVVEEDRLGPYLERLRTAEGVPTEASRLAGQLVSDGVLTLFQAEQILQGRWKRFTIGKYRVLERLGSGSMGQVYLCEHKVMRRRVAVKVLPNAKSGDTQALERFYREARAVAALDHPNLARAFDIDQDHSVHFLVMEYVDGVSLHDLVKRRGAIDPIRAAHYIFQSALGLEYAFKVASLVHRDIKPGNILVDRAGVVKVLDMGLARFFNDENDAVTLTHETNILGTADYVAPEQAINSHAADIRSDIYSLGATFYHLLAGQPPFPDGSMAQKLMAHQMRQPKSLRDLRPEIPDGLVAIVEKMMSKNPAERFQTPDAVAEALAPWTATPSPPPADDELPDLSLAAQGNATAQAAHARITAKNAFASQKGRTSSGMIPTIPRSATATADVINGPDSDLRGSGPSSSNPFGLRPDSSAKHVTPNDRAVLESVYLTGSGSQRFDSRPPSFPQPQQMPMSATTAGAVAFVIGIVVFVLTQRFMH